MGIFCPETPKEIVTLLHYEIVGIIALQVCSRPIDDHDERPVWSAVEGPNGEARNCVLSRSLSRRKCRLRRPVQDGRGAGHGGPPALEGVKHGGKLGDGLLWTLGIEHG